MSVKDLLLSHIEKHSAFAGNLREALCDRVPVLSVATISSIPLLRSGFSKIHFAYRPMSADVDERVFFFAHRRCKDLEIGIIWLPLRSKRLQHHIKVDDRDMHSPHHRGRGLMLDKLGNLALTARVAGTDLGIVLPQLRGIRQCGPLEVRNAALTRK
jgi:hypothetical protein